MLSRAQRLKKRKLERATPQAEDPGGLYIPDGLGGYEFLSWLEVEACARGTMETPEWFAAREYGKPNWKSDPTYNMKRKK